MSYLLRTSTNRTRGFVGDETGDVGGKRGDAVGVDGALAQEDSGTDTTEIPSHSHQQSTLPR